MAQLSTFHFNCRDVSFRHNLSVIDGSGVLVTTDRRVIPFDSIRVGLDEVNITDAENSTKVGWKDIEMVVVKAN